MQNINAPNVRPMPLISTKVLVVAQREGVKTPPKKNTKSRILNQATFLEFSFLKAFSSPSPTTTFVFHAKTSNTFLSNRTCANEKRIPPPLLRASAKRPFLFCFQNKVPKFRDHRGVDESALHGTGYCSSIIGNPDRYVPPI